MFIGVLPERAWLFKPQPVSDVAVSDAAAWRLNPAHRQVYDKLTLALAAGLHAAPCGVDPRDLGVNPETELFVKPIINLAGMALGAGRARADAIPHQAGAFWCECLEGEHTSSDCLVQTGEPLWCAHTCASSEKNQERPLWWEVGVARPDLDARVAEWVQRLLPGYTGLCNLELIGGQPIEMHLRGSNGFFELYGPEFIPAWVALMDGTPCEPPPPVAGGLILSVFGTRALDAEEQQALQALDVEIRPDSSTPDRVAVLCCRDRASGWAAWEQLRARSG